MHKPDIQHDKQEQTEVEKKEIKDEEETKTEKLVFLIL